MECPYCHAPMAAKPEYNLNPGQIRMFEAIVEAGPMGIETKRFKERFFQEDVPHATVRTTLFRLNKRIGPLRIVSRFGTLRITT